MGIVLPKGNLMVLALCALLLSACGTTKKSTVVTPASPTPKIVDAPKEEVEDTLVSITPKVKSITVALLLTLKLDEHFANDTNPDTNPLILQETLSSLNFYEGALAASDTLSTEIRKINFRIIDTGIDSLSTISTLNTTNMSDVNAVVSFLPANYTSFLSRISNRWEKPLYLFAATNTTVLEKNKWIRLLNPSNYTQITQAAGFVSKQYTNEKIIAVYRDQKGENLIANLFAGVIDSSLSKPGACEKVNYKSDGFNSIKAKLSRSKKNVLIIPTSDESFLSSILNKLIEVKEDHQFVLIGMPAWENFNSIDPETMKEFGAIIFNGMYIDTQCPQLNQFRKKFIAAYHADPTLAAYMGYDAVNCIVKEVENNLTGREIRFNSLLNSGSEILLAPVCETCGLETKAINLLKYGEYEFVLVK
jgi:hypothetical protein